MVQRNYFIEAGLATVSATCLYKLWHANQDYFWNRAIKSTCKDKVEKVAISILAFFSPPTQVDCDRYKALGLLETIEKDIQLKQEEGNFYDMVAIACMIACSVYVSFTLESLVEVPEQPLEHEIPPEQPPEPAVQVKPRTVRTHGIRYLKNS